MLYQTLLRNVDVGTTVRPRILDNMFNIICIVIGRCYGYGYGLRSSPTYRMDSLLHLSYVKQDLRVRCVVCVTGRTRFDPARHVATFNTKCVSNVTS